MFWLISQMWFLLLTVFSLGLAIGWWTWGSNHLTAVLPENPLLDPKSMVRGCLEGENQTTPRQPKLYQTATKGTPDDLTQIIGVDKSTEQTLNDVGVYYLYQIADWGPSRIKWIENKIAAQGRVSTERWVAQARSLRLG